ncbi:MAG: sulfatase [Chloroflexota bacterium]
MNGTDGAGRPGYAAREAPFQMPLTDAPNILWFCADQQRFDTIGALGNPHVRTPTLDRLVREGVSFSRAYCQSPICTPSRASFLTGRYPSSIRVTRNGNPFFWPDERLVTRRLADGGYNCGLVGKLHLAGAAFGREPRVDDGYRYVRYSHAPRDQWSRGHDYADWIREQGHDPATVLPSGFNVHDDLREPTPEHDNTPPELHQSTWCAEMAIDFIKKPRSGPWMLSVNPFAPHAPFDPPWEYYRRYDPETMPDPWFEESDLPQQDRLGAVDFQTRSRQPSEIRAKHVRAAYYAMIEQLDEQLGRIVQAIEEAGQLEQTAIVFTSDHGEMLGDHGLTHKGCRFYEGLVRVPLIWWWPGRVASGVKRDALVELTDIAPTLLDLAGLPIPGRMQGRSLQPLLTDAAAEDAHRAFVRCEFLDALDMPDESRATMYCDGRWKLTVYHGHDIGELYDLAADPHEHRDLWDDPAHASIKLALMQRSFDATVAALDLGPERIMPN